MKNRFILLQVLAVLSLLFMTSCNKTPGVFSLNNFTSALSEDGGVKAVAPLPAKGIEGTWTGMGHYIKIIPGSINNLDIYTAEMIDTNKNAVSGIDTTSYSLLFITVAGHPFAEIISEGSHINAHDFMLPISTHLKINKFSRDTIIVQMPASKFTTTYIKANGYNYFIPDEFKNKNEFPVYITETPDRLADLLNKLCNFPGAFQPPDTILRKH